MSRYKHILFDLDGTIFDTYFANMDALLCILNKIKPNHNENMETLARFFGIPGHKTLGHLGFSEIEINDIFNQWVSEVHKRIDTVRIYDGMLSVLAELKRRNFKLGIITSRRRIDSGDGDILTSHIPLEIREFFDLAICANDVENPKPDPEPILKYIQITKAKPEEIVFIGDTKTDNMCAIGANVDFALALWGYCDKDFVRCKHYLKNTYDILSIVLSDKSNYEVLNIARELAAISQNGLAYAKDDFDRERYQRVGEIACNMLATYTNTDFETVKSSILFDKGYRTLKVDVRGVIFNSEGKLLLVKERRNNLWSLPGGWCEDNLTVAENVVKEIREEACIETYVIKLLALYDRNKHNTPPLPFGVVKVFCLCADNSGVFRENVETIDRKYFSLDEIPFDSLRVDTSSEDQIRMCFDAYNNPNLSVIVE